MSTTPKKFDPRNTHVGNVIDTGTVDDPANNEEPLTFLRTADGGYPIIYVCHDGQVLCHECACEQFLKEIEAEQAKIKKAALKAQGLDDSEIDEPWIGKGERLFAADIYYEGEAETCTCNAKIESYYGDPDAPEGEKEMTDEN